MADGEKGTMAAMFGKPSLAIYSQISQKLMPNNCLRDVLYKFSILKKFSHPGNSPKL
jgi:hypothetical protein